MGRRPFIPPQLTKRPFCLGEARNAGLTRSGLRSKAWRRLGSELYCWSGLREDHWLLLSAWRRLLPPESVFAGATAAWLLGLDLSPTNPVEIVVPARSGVRSRDGLRVRHCVISPRETVTVRALRATTLRRTLSDLCLRLSAVEALVIIDMAITAGLTDPSALSRDADAMKGRPGGRTRRVPMETRLRWLLIQAGLPVPEVQTDLRDSKDRFVARADLYYRSARLVIEYDGGNHRERLVEDDRRQNLLISAGFHLLRFTAADLHGRPDVVVAQVRASLGG